MMYIFFEAFNRVLDIDTTLRTLCLYTNFGLRNTTPVLLYRLWDYTIFAIFRSYKEDIGGTLSPNWNFRSKTKKYHFFCRWCFLCLYHKLDMIYLTEIIKVFEIFNLLLLQILSTDQLWFTVGFPKADWNDLSEVFARK